MSDARQSPAKQGVKNAESYMPVVDRSMTVQEAIASSPDVSGIMAEYGLHCSSCAIGGMETLAEGCAMHGFDEEKTDALIEDINDSIREMPRRPFELEVTEDAARSLEDIAKREGKTECGLAVVKDGHGGFCMEFREEKQEDDLVFFHESYPTVSVFASPEVLWHIGGATIDHREERFKLDLPSDGCGSGSCCSGGGCGCK